MQEATSGEYLRALEHATENDVRKAIRAACT